VQAHSNPERERRRLIARKGVSPEEALAAIPNRRAEQLDLPFLLLSSRSTGQQFRLFVEHLPIADESRPGNFGSYGLSPATTIPWF
jgi:CRISPR-associated endonuclease Csy4